MKYKIMYQILFFFSTSMLFAQTWYFPVENHSTDDFSSSFASRTYSSANYPNSGYDYDFHAAFDIGNVTIGDNVIAIEDGFIEYISPNTDANENLVLLCTDGYSDYAYRYFHFAVDRTKYTADPNSEPTKTNVVCAGDVIGKIKDLSPNYSDHLDIRYYWNLELINSSSSEAAAEWIGTTNESNKYADNPISAIDALINYSDQPRIVDSYGNEITQAQPLVIMTDPETNYYNPANRPYIEFGVRVDDDELDIEKVEVQLSAYSYNYADLYSTWNLIYGSSITTMFPNIVNNSIDNPINTRINVGDQGTNNSDVGHNSPFVGIYPRNFNRTDSYHTVYYRWYLNDLLLNNIDFSTFVADIRVWDVYDVINNSNPVSISYIPVISSTSGGPDGVPGPPVLSSATLNQQERGIELEITPGVGEPVNYFRIYRCTNAETISDDDLVGICSASPDGNYPISYIDKNILDPGTIYKYVVAGVNSIGEGLNSSVQTCRYGEELNSNYTVSQTIGGIYYVTQNIEIYNNCTLTIDEGSIIKFNNSARLIVDGTLILNGVSDHKIILDFEEPSWPNGIEVLTTGTSIIDNCVIKNAYYGIKANGHISVDYCEIAYCTFGIFSSQSGFNIRNSTLHGNEVYNIHILNNNNSITGEITSNKIYDGNYGIYLYNSSPTILNNEIYNHNTSGVYCCNYSSPSLGGDGFHGYNYIHNNNYGVRAYGHSNPVLGEYSCTDWAGNNSFSSNTKHLYASSYSHISAQCNWWGTSPPVSSEFFNDATSEVTYTNYLTSDPFATNAASSEVIAERNSSVLKLNSSNINSKILALYDESAPLKWKVSFANNLYLLGHYKMAAEISSGLLKANIDNPQSHRLLDIIYQSARMLEDRSVLKIFDEIVTDENKEIFAYIKMIMASGTENEQSVLEKLQKKYKNKKVLEDILFREVAFFTNEKPNYFKAQSAYKELKAKYPNSILVKEAEQMLGNVSTFKAAATEEESAKVFRYQLFGNYPNPFNPSTTIRYSIGENSFVTLKVYDILGREVKTLVNERQETGEYNIVFNGKNLSSGVYIYQLKAGSFVATNKFILNK